MTDLPVYCEKNQCRMLTNKTCADRYALAQEAAGLSIWQMLSGMDVPLLEDCLECDQGRQAAIDNGVKIPKKRRRKGCRVHDCDKVHYGRGYCKYHYYKNWYYKTKKRRYHDRKADSDMPPVREDVGSSVLRAMP